MTLLSLFIVLIQVSHLLVMIDTNACLEYYHSAEEGEMRLFKVKALKKIMWKYVTFLIVNLLTLCIPYLLSRWYPQVLLWFYYDAQSSCNEASHVWVLNYDSTQDIVPLQRSALFQGQQKCCQEVLYFKHRYLRYRITLDSVVQVLKYYEEQRLINYGAGKGEGWAHQQANSLLVTYGEGGLAIQKPSLCQILTSEVLRPLYIFLFYAVISQIYLKYYQYSFAILAIAIVGISIEVYEIDKSYDRIAELAEHRVDVRVMRQGKIIVLSSDQVVPGDLVILQQTLKIPFDGVIIDGEVLIDEAALTGQSVPVHKRASLMSQQTALKENSKVYSGTTTLQVKHQQIELLSVLSSQYGALIYVTHTNYLTVKGQLVRKILYPQQLQNSFQKQANWFLLFLLLFCLVSFMLMCIKLRLIEQLNDLIVICVPPTLPISLTVGISVAVNNLKKIGIFTIAPTKLINGGLLNCLCFDKTGTLTEDSMELVTIQPYYGGEFISPISEIQQTFETLDSSNLRTIVGNIGANHSVVELDTTKQLIGDPMQVDALRKIEAQITSDNEAHTRFAYESKLGFKGKVLKTFQFDSNLQRTSAIAQDNFCTDGSFIVYCKGSPETLNSLYATDIGSEYTQTLKQYTSQGLRVLACASRKIEGTMLSQSRQTLQSELTFDGFLVFKNKLKPQTRPSIQALKSVDIHPVMITGDNAITACQIAYQAGFVSQNQKTAVIAFQAEDQIFIVQEFAFEATLHSQATIKSKEDILQYLQSIQNSEAVSLCLTGDAFETLLGDSLNEQSQAVDSTALQALSNVQVFSRSKPHQKAKIIKLYQKMGQTVGMCGDGANDCEALTQAHIGLSLSDTEASVAAPFTSKQRNIGAMVELIKHGRGALATNISLFNIVCLYAFTQYTTTMLNFFMLTYITESNFIYWDIFINFPCIVLLPLVPVAHQLCLQRPLAHLLSFRNLSQLVVAFVLQLTAQIVSLVAIGSVFSDQLGYGIIYGPDINLAYYQDNGKMKEESIQMNAMFLVVNLLYIVQIVTFTVTKPWKQPIYKSLLFSVFLGCMAALSLLAFSPFSLTRSLLHLEFITSTEVLLFLLGQSLVLGAVMFVVINKIMQPYFMINGVVSH